MSAAVRGDEEPGIRPCIEPLRVRRVDRHPVQLLRRHRRDRTQGRARVVGDEESAGLERDVDLAGGNGDSARAERAGRAHRPPGGAVVVGDERRAGADICIGPGWIEQRAEGVTAARRHRRPRPPAVRRPEDDASAAAMATSGLVGSMATDRASEPESPRSSRCQAGPVSSTSRCRPNTWTVAVTFFVSPNGEESVAEKVPSACVNPAAGATAVLMPLATMLTGIAGTSAPSTSRTDGQRHRRAGRRARGKSADARLREAGRGAREHDVPGEGHRSDGGGDDFVLLHGGSEGRREHAVCAGRARRVRKRAAARGAQNDLHAGDGMVERVCHPHPDARRRHAIGADAHRGDGERGLPRIGGTRNELDAGVQAVAVRLQHQVPAAHLDRFHAGQEYSCRRLPHREQDRTARRPWR